MNNRVDKNIKSILKTLKFENEISKIEKDKEKYYELIEKYGVTKRLNNIIDNFEADDIQESKLFKKLDINIGVICDEFLYYSLKDTANFVYIPFSENMEVDENLDVLLVVTSWRGLDHSWDYVANPNGRVRKALLDLINLYRESGITTVFYSKEDPVSYDQYLSIATECDYIFTSASEMIEKYKKDTGNQNVDYLEFGINPIYHNPIGKDLTDKSLNSIVTFAGSWMVRFPRRNDESLEIFKGVYKAGYQLSIIDRQFERHMERYHYPSFLIKNISETIPHERLMKLHKATKWGINLNSVQESNTMFANRVYELQAMGNVIISNYNRGVHNKFPSVQLVNSSKDVESLVRDSKLIDQKELIAEGIRNVMLNHTSFHRMSKVFKVLGIDYDIKNPSILVIGEGEHVKKSFDRQIYTNKTLVSNSEFDNSRDIIKNYDYVAKFSNGIAYGEYYLENLLATFAYMNADVVSMNEDKYKYVDQSNYVENASMISSEKFYSINENNNEVKFFNIPQTEMEKTDNNTEETLLKDISRLSVIIPVRDEDIYYLESKTLYSLRGLNINIRVVPYNNVSPKNETLLERIARKYKNVDCFLEDTSSNVNRAVNSSISSIQSEFFFILSPGNQVSRSNIKVFLKDLENVNEDIVLCEINNLIASRKESNSFELESGIFSTEFIKENQVNLDEAINVINNSFLVEAFSKASSVKYLTYNLVNKMKDTEGKESNNIYLLEEYKKVESKTISILLESGLVSEYANTQFPEKFLNVYFPLFKDSDKDERISSLNLLEEIYKKYEKFYDGNNSKLNEITELLFS